VGEKAANLLNEFDKLPAPEKESPAVEILAHAQAQGLPPGAPAFEPRVLERSNPASAKQRLRLCARACEHQGGTG
jgi:hypothetical protein